MPCRCIDGDGRHIGRHMRCARDSVVVIVALSDMERMVSGNLLINLPYELARTRIGDCTQQLFAFGRELSTTSAYCVPGRRFSFDFRVLSPYLEQQP